LFEIQTQNLTVSTGEKYGNKSDPKNTVSFGFLDSFVLDSSSPFMNIYFLEISPTFLAIYVIKLFLDFIPEFFLILCIVFPSS
jgi:hypothetical protein